MNFDLPTLFHSDLSQHWTLYFPNGSVIINPFGQFFPLILSLFQLLMLEKV